MAHASVNSILCKGKIPYNTSTSIRSWRSVLNNDLPSHPACLPSFPARPLHMIDCNAAGQCESKFPGIKPGIKQIYYVSCRKKRAEILG